MDVKAPAASASASASHVPAHDASPQMFTYQWQVSASGAVTFALTPTPGFVDPAPGADFDALALHACVFRGDPPHVLHALLRSQRYDVNGVDAHGNTPLHLCAMLSVGRLEHARLLCAYGAHNKTRNRAGWTPVQEAVSMAQRDMLALLWVNTKQKTKQQLRERAPLILDHIRRMPDFSMTLHWQFSSWIPFVSRFCPSDDYKIQKLGTSLRVDTTLADFKGLSWKRGDISFIITFEDAQRRKSDAPADTKGDAKDGKAAPTAAAAAAPAAAGAGAGATAAAGAGGSGSGASDRGVKYRASGAPKETIWVLDNEAKTYNRLSGGDDDASDPLTSAGVGDEDESWATRSAELQTQLDLLLRSANTCTTSPGRFKYTRALSGFIGFRTPRVDTVGTRKADVWECSDMRMLAQRRVEHLTDDDIRRLNEARSTVTNAALLTSKLKDSAEKLEKQEKEREEARIRAGGKASALPHKPKLPDVPHRPSLPLPPPHGISFDAYFGRGAYANAGAPVAAGSAGKKAGKGDASGDTKALYAFHLGRPVRIKEELKSYTATVGMCTHFPLSVATVIELLDILTPVHRNVEKLCTFLRAKMPAPGFPVSVEMPVFPTISAKVQFLQYDTAPVDPERFMIPGDYSLELKPGEEFAPDDDDVDGTDDAADAADAHAAAK